jgi:hypothetical protein
MNVIIKLIILIFILDLKEFLIFKQDLKDINFIIKIYSVIKKFYIIFMT